jgi:hypothetical protein
MRRPDTAIRPESKIERDRDEISLHNWHALLWDTVHIFSQERQTRVKRGDWFAEFHPPVLATDTDLTEVDRRTGTSMTAMDVTLGCTGVVQNILLPAIVTVALRGTI